MAHATPDWRLCRTVIFIDELLENEKRKLINQIAESINHSEEESLKRGMNQLCKAETFLGYNAKELKNQIRTSLRIIDEKKRTVRDVMITEAGQVVEGKEIVFSSHKKADTAREIVADFMSCHQTALMSCL